MRTLVLLTGVLLALSACQEKQSTPVAKRAEVRRLGGNRLELLPTEGQLPYCLVFTRSQNGVLRQLTMTHENKSVPCPAGQPIGKVSYRIPLEEGPVTLLVFFSDQKLNAASVGQQLYELPPGQQPTAMNLRLPGQVFAETLQFLPEAESAATVGGVVGAGGEVAGPDAGSAAPSPGAAPAADGGSANAG